LDQIAQIPGLKGIVTALYDIRIGEIWPSEAIEARGEAVAGVGLRWEVVESLNVHEDIKLGRDSRDVLIDAYSTSLQNLGAAGIPVVCYNFMPVFDWMRTTLSYELPDGSKTLRFAQSELEALDLSFGAAGLPGWGDAFTREQLTELMAAYEGFDAERLWGNYAYFLERVIPAAASAGVKMAIHPADPPWSIFGLPRIIVDERALERLLQIVDHPANGITFCTGSLGANPENDLPRMIRRFGDRIHFAHCRNVEVTGDRQFHEVSHSRTDGNVDLKAVMSAYRDIGFLGPIRPDHGRMIWGETGLAGYGLFDRALGATYIQALWDGLSKV